ncbi:uncharacterized protein B0H18DRAFT_1115831 [Fomitopsis serialis]|uniref:uncharacterized protein n=1 Tax=Fomitopsis serialis TaxID=139415 RepID=UPI002007908B|nr:uncharacterized protein B0H18DRAFT_1115831 [Neoantrodia serialis]KAH9932600.1 hypothetical protein B0H18DRAFT_1115831 [Neoantrodia serialis]
MAIERVPNPSAKLSDSDQLIEDSVALFSSVFQTNTATISLVGGDVSLLGAMVRSMIKAALVAGGEYYPALDENDSDELTGYALWLPPGRDLFDTPEQRDLGFNDFMASLPEAGKRITRTSYVLARKDYSKESSTFVDECMGGPKGKIDAWWLLIMVVRPEKQKQGIGRRLIETVKKKATEKGQTLACSTTRDNNVRVYTSYGFEQKGVKRCLRRGANGHSESNAIVAR